MISLWVLVSQHDVQAYAGTLLLPSYLSHLRLGPFEFSAQGENRDGQEPLRLTYVGAGRLEEVLLEPKQHALGLIRHVCPNIDGSRIQLPRDDASWHWTTSAERPEPMRVYFAPTTRRLSSISPPIPSEEAYVSVSRGHVFVGRRVVQSYLEAWLASLGISDPLAEFDFGTPSGEVEFRAGAVGGQLSLSDDVLAEDIMRFAGLEKPLGYVSELVELDLRSAGEDGSGVYDDGIYIHLSGRTAGRNEQ